MKKNILIIGSSGYIGNRLKIMLRSKYNLITPNKKKLDITKLKKLKKYINQDIHYVINLSGQISNNKKLMKNIIINGNKNIIKICKNKNIKVFYLSTSLVYGFSNKICKEISLKNPIDDYAKFKLIAEREYIKSNIDYKILRLCNIYNGKKNGIVKKLITSFQKNKIVYLTNPLSYRNYIHINDAINIITHMLEKKLKHKIYNIGYENIKLIDIVNNIKKKTETKVNYINKNFKIEKIPSQKISSLRIFSEIAYKPKENLKDYLIKKL